MFFCYFCNKLKIEMNRIQLTLKYISTSGRLFIKSGVIFSGPVERLCLLLITALAVAALSCSHDDGSLAPRELVSWGGYPDLSLEEGRYYLIYQSASPDSIFLYSASSIDGLRNDPGKLIWSPQPGGMKNIYSSELHRMDDKWYIYFEADNGESTDNHQLYVLENPAADPLTGNWTLHGPIVTSEEWNFGLHPTTFSHAGRRYLLWSGWPKRRAEVETQCIYIAELENPWTLKSERVMISEPEYEWERQWINPDGSRTAYPIYVNENPQVILSPDGKRIAVAYSASGIWTEYHTLGLLWADADSDLLDPSSWHKLPEPLFRAPEGEGLRCTSNISVIKSEADGKPVYHMAYEERYKDKEGLEQKRILWKEIEWSDKGLPEFGEP